MRVCLCVGLTMPNYDNIVPTEWVDSAVESNQMCHTIQEFFMLFCSQVTIFFSLGLSFIHTQTNTQTHSRTYSQHFHGCLEVTAPTHAGTVI